MSFGDFSKSSDLHSRKASQTFDLANTAFCGATTGSANAYVISFPLDFPNLARILNGQEFRVVPNFTCTGASTATIPGIGSLSIKRYDGTTALAQDDIVSGSPITLAYDSVNTVLRLVKPSIGGNVQASLVDTTRIDASVGNIDDVNATTVDATTVTATTGNITTGNITTINSTTGNIGDVNATTVDATTVTATTGTFTNITSAWTSWTPTVTDTGAGTFTPVNTYYRYRVIGKEIYFRIECRGTSTASITTVELTLPGGITIQSVNHYNPILIEVGGGTELGKVLINNTTISIQRFDGSAWATTSSGMFRQVVRAELQ